MSSNLKDLRQFMGGKKQIDGQDLVRIVNGVEGAMSDVENKMKKVLDERIKVLTEQVEEVLKQPLAIYPEEQQPEDEPL